LPADPRDRRRVNPWSRPSSGRVLQQGRLLGRSGFHRNQPSPDPHRCQAAAAAAAAAAASWASWAWLLASSSAGRGRPRESANQ
jgi:hypothetical protein